MKPVRNNLAAGALLAASLTASGCAGGGAHNTAARYPYAQNQGEVLDIQVFLKPTTLVLTNTTAREFGPTRIWLNQRFSRDVDSIDVGESLELKLSGFRDEFGEKWRGGGFFATETPERLVLAQLEPLDSEGLGAGLLGMIVVARQEQ